MDVATSGDDRLASAARSAGIMVRDGGEQVVSGLPDVALPLPPTVHSVRMRTTADPRGDVPADLVPPAPVHRRIRRGRPEQTV